MATHLHRAARLLPGARERSWWWAAAAAAVWGLAMSSKVNALFVPLIVSRGWRCARATRLAPAVVCGATRRPAGFLADLAVAVARHPQRLAAYLRFHVHHWQIAVTYFGRSVRACPVAATRGDDRDHHAADHALAAALGGAVRVVRERAAAHRRAGWRERWQDPAWRRRAAAALLGWALP